MELFEKHTLKDITLDRLSKISGVSAFDIIREFQSSDMILKAVLERELELMAAAAREPQLRMAGETMEDELRVLAGVILDQILPPHRFHGQDARRGPPRPQSLPDSTIRPSLSGAAGSSRNSSEPAQSTVTLPTVWMWRRPPLCFSRRSSAS
jgi:hypothetical protein